MDWYNNFFTQNAVHMHVMSGHYNFYLVFLSYVIACLASYVALDMSAHLRKPTTLAFHLTWLAGGAFVMGAGIWSMHFIGMLAYEMSMPMTYDIGWTGLSMLVAVVTSLIAFLLFMQKNPRLMHYLLAGLLLGIAIPSMHYTGMAGMNGVHISYDPGIFSLSVIIAIIAASVALWLSVMSDKGSTIKKMRLKIGSALIMGVAICGMHYTGMFAAVITHGKMVEEALPVDPTLMSVFIATITISILLVALILSTTKYYLDASLKSKSDFLEAVINNISGGVIVCNSKEALTLQNSTITKLYGPMLNKLTSIGEWAKAHPLYKADDETTKLDEYPLFSALQGKEVKDIEVIMKDYKGKKHVMSVDGSQLRDTEDENMGALIVLNDISQRKDDEELLRYRATHDMLTDLPNKTLLLDRLNQAIVTANRQNTKVSVIFIDLDNFKYINDALGHSIGDQLLKVVAKRFKALLRASDTLARFGGDEFVIVVTDQEDVHNSIRGLLERILASIAEPYVVQKHKLNITCSIGFSTFPESGKDVETLLKNADNAMYQAKEKGKNNYQFFNTLMNTQIRRRFEVESDLRSALLNEEFFLEYQPKLDIKNNHIMGYEALVRWRHPKLGVIPPLEFISIAEETGLIIPIGDWVLRKACKQNKEWQDAGMPPLRVSVNLSARQCKESGLFNKIKKILEETGLDPQYLELELTESTAMSNPVEFIKMLEQFREYGIKTSIDDFGTGYSSLNYLRQFPVGCLKIDKSFIDEITKKDGDLSIVKAIVSLGHSLNMDVIAEGVETKQQLKHLMANDCDEIQGYYLSRPLSAENMVDFIKNYPKNKK